MLLLIKIKLYPLLKWKLSKIEKLHSGKDEVCRVVTVLTSHGFMQKPLIKLCPLPCNK